MTPNFLKSNVGGGAGHTPTPQPIQNTSDTSNGSKMDGDHTAKSMEQGANSATKGATDLTEGLHETAKQTPAAGEKTTGQGTSVFSKDGAVGKHFNADGAIGGTAQSIGGPLDKQGMIGKHFGADGQVGGTFQQLAEKNESH